MISENLAALRKVRGLSQETVAGQIGVTRQALSKWESGETTPDLTNVIALARLYEVTIDDLVHYSPDEHYGIPIAPKGKHIFGNTTIGERGQIVIPKKARDIFNLHPGDNLIVLGDEEQGLALIKEENLLELINHIKSGIYSE
ncbi:MAG: helix-turn-helix domain-containing protein [Lachnospira sp.]|nr:helix-turn-helix domain-containing protein [Lachnospira sp.]